VTIRVRALNARQEVIALDLEVDSVSSAIEAAHKRGLAVLSTRRSGLSGLRRTSFPTTLFTMELVLLLEAGLNIAEALQTLGEQASGGERQAVLEGILARIRRGESFSLAVSHYPQHFPALYVATLKASERTGDVREALSRYIAYQEELDRVRAKVVAASIYPAILIGVATLVLAFLLLYVVPRFALAYEGVSGNLPFFSALLIGVGGAIRENGWLVAFGCAASLATAAWGVSRAGVRGRVYHLIWRAPVIGERMKAYQLARLYRTVGMLLRAGIPLSQALEMVRELLAAHLRPQLERARMLVQEGKSLSSAFGATGLATPVAARMMLVGERSGEMAEMMGQIARFHDEQTARFVEWFTRGFEPLLMAALGVAVGLIVVLMYMPVFELAGSIR
jgi:general secretion pathway protein F